MLAAEFVAGSGCLATCILPPAMSESERCGDRASLSVQCLHVERVYYNGTPPTISMTIIATQE